MSQPTKQLAFSVMPRPLPRPALAVAAALVGLALTGTHALALGAGAAFGTCATSGDICTSGGQVAAVALCLVAAFGAAIGLFNLRQLGKRRQQVSPMVPACVLLVVLVAACAGVLVAFASPIMIGSTSSLPGAAGQSIRF